MAAKVPPFAHIGIDTLGEGAQQGGGGGSLSPEALALLTEILTALRGTLEVDLPDNLIENDRVKVETQPIQALAPRDQYPRAVARLSDGTLKYYAINYGGKIAPQGFKDVRS